MLKTIRNTLADVSHAADSVSAHGRVIAGRIEADHFQVVKAAVAHRRAADLASVLMVLMAAALVVEVAVKLRAAVR